jgi:hypothetical protein
MDGARTFLWSGAIHYPRSTPGMWPSLMKRSKDAGLNAIETYVFWNLHERKRNVFDFSGRLDLLRFCELAQQHELDVLLRIGPYICAEINYGGLPAWLRDVPDICMRTLNQPFMREMARWVRFVCNYLQPMFAPNGGPIIAAQIENEYGMVAPNYGKPGQQYLRWSIELGQSLNLGIPWIMCFGGMPGALETINWFYGHECIESHQAEHPEQPLLWTENWTGWYDTWGVPHHVRSAEDEAYGVLRFVAAGGTGVNYYMWHGGTNFGREAMYLQTTSYDYDAPLDEFGLPTTKSNHIARLHRALKPYEPMLLASERAQPVVIGHQQFAYRYPGLTFFCNDADVATNVRYGGHSFSLAPKSVVAWDGVRVVFDSHHIHADDVAQRGFATAETDFTHWQTWLEPLPSLWPLSSPPAVIADAPIEQLSLTRDETDYCWYSTSFTANGPGTLTLNGVADVAHIFVDGKLMATTKMPILEDRGSLEGSNVTGFSQAFELALEAGTHLLDVLCCAVGLIKGDWQIGNANMADEKKGLWGNASWNGSPIKNKWAMRVGLLYERAASRLPHPLTSNEIGKPLRWYRTTFARPVGQAFAVDMGSMNKGMAWVNGHCLGRYWLAAGTGANAEFISGSPIRDVDAGQSTQRYYHLPADWLSEHNELIVFEELGGDPTKIVVCERV